MVVIFLPATAETGTEHERTAAPSRCTVHAPQAATPQPNFVPVSPTTSRIAHNRGIVSGTSRWWDTPLITKLTMGSSVSWVGTDPVNSAAAKGSLVPGSARLALVFYEYNAMRDGLHCLAPKRIGPMKDELGVLISPPAVAELGAYFKNADFIDAVQVFRGVRMLSHRMNEA